jgi:hypothetical protein
MTGGAITGRIDEAIEQNTRNRCLRRPERQRQAGIAGGPAGIVDLHDLQRLILA